MFVCSCFQKNRQYISWKTIEALYQRYCLDGCGLSILPKLTAGHVHLNSNSRMKVKLAVQVATALAISDNYYFFFC